MSLRVFGYYQGVEGGLDPSQLPTLWVLKRREAHAKVSPTLPKRISSRRLALHDPFRGIVIWVGSWCLLHTVRLPNWTVEPRNRRTAWNPLWG
ncbi:hypothetical protein L209DRAFT_754213 [Thermothelomyces heterothallicus CBS 203.75]